MINCNECVPTIEESLNNISEYYEGIICLLGIFVAVVLLYLVIKLIKLVYHGNEESVGD